MEKEFTGKTTEEAIRNGLEQLGLSRDDVEVEVVETSNKGLFGFIGQKDAKVLIRFDDGEKSEEISGGAGETVKKTAESKETFESVVSYVKEILSKMGIDSNVEITSEDNIMNINISGDGMGIVIGRRGETLDALQHIIQLYVNRNIEKFYKVRLDTESYRAKREEALTNLANGIAKRVMKTRKEVVLEPMKAYERRIIHTALQDYPRIKTYSIGDEPNRKIIVAFKYSERSGEAEAADTDTAEE